jgi:dihydroneopterin aldolase
MLFIHLHNVRFFCRHGLHEEETLLGNEYEVNVSVGIAPVSLPVYQLDQTIDYTELLHIVKTRMELPTALLETLATEIAREIQSRYPRVEKISISIRKLYPPVNSFEGSLGVSFEWNK